MGPLFSYIRDFYRGICVVISTLLESNEDFRELLARIHAPRPVATHSTQSFWQQYPLFPELADIKSENLPREADIVIIGSGISGASIAHTILSECAAMGIEKRVVVLEARQICSGATGRNGGHIKSSVYHEFSNFKARFGTERARKLVEFQINHLPTLLSVVRKYGLENTEVREVETVDAFMEPTMWKKALLTVEELKEGMPEVAAGVHVWTADLAREKFRLTSDCEGAISYKAGACWPYRFVTSLYTYLLSRYESTFSIETGTPVERIDVRDGPTYPYIVRTARGNIAANHVIHATDSFAPTLVPGLTGKLFPVRGHMSAQRPGQAFPRWDGSKSWSIVNQTGFEYISQRPGNPDATDGIGGELMIGGGMTQSWKKGMDEVGIWNDDQVNFPIASYLGGVLSVVFGQQTWGVDANGSRVKQLWTGCMGFTADMLPFVGKLDPVLTGRKLSQTRKMKETPGTIPPSEWISAGFGGEGMVLAWLSGVAVGLMVLGRENIHSNGRAGWPEGKLSHWFPSEMICSRDRITKSSVYDLASYVTVM